MEMENSPSNSIEKQIDNFLEHFMRSASKAMDADWTGSSTSAAAGNANPHSSQNSNGLVGNGAASNSNGGIAGTNQLFLQCSKNRVSSLDITELSASEDRLLPKQVDPDTHLLNVLRKIDKYNYHYVFARCKECNVNARQLKYLEKEHLRELIPISNLGTRAEFEYLFREWKLKNGYVTNIDNITTTRIPQNGRRAVSPQTKTRTKRVRTENCNDASPSHVLLENEYSAVRTYIDDDEESQSSASHSSPVAAQNIDSSQSESYLLSEIIPLVLKMCQQKFKTNQGLLTEIDRRLLSTSIVEYFLNRNMQLTAGTFDHLAEQIVKYFPTESKLAWYDNRNTKGHGRLHVKFYNSQRSKVKSKRRKQETDPINTNSPLAFAEDDSMDEEPDEEMVQIQKWLKCNKCEDMDEVITMWRNSLAYRKRQLRNVRKSTHGISGILNDWPSYTWPTGHFLLNIDFNHLYPKSESAFLERWFIFMNKISNLYEAELKDDASLELFKEFRICSNKLNTDSKEATLLKLLHGITESFGGIDEPDDGQRNSIVESQSSVMKLIEHVSELNSHEAQTHPCIFLVGESILKVDRCMLAFRKIQYELSFSDAICACFQLYMVFKLEFPPASLNFWNFISGYFFDIHTEYESTFAVLDHIVQYLETM